MAYFFSIIFLSFSLSFSLNIHAAQIVYDGQTRPTIGNATASIFCNKQTNAITSSQAKTATFTNLTSTESAFTCFYSIAAVPPYTTSTPGGKWFRCNTTDIFQTFTNAGLAACTCPVDTVKNSATGNCDTPCQQLIGVTTKSYTYSAVSEPPQSVCKDGCLAPVTDLSLCVLPKVGSTDANCIGTYKFNGLSCTASTVVNVSVPTTEQQCIANGQSYGTVNGTVVCVAKGSAGAATSNQTSAGSTTTTNSASNTNTTTNSTVINNTVKTTTTTTNPDGTVNTETKEQDKQSFCDQNPNLSICKTNDFAGSCSGFSCSGDAIQCAISKEQHKRNCELFNNESSLTIDGKSLNSGTAVDNSPAKTANRETLNVASMINEGQNIGSGSFVDKVIPLKGGGLTLPFSKLNFIMQILGSFILAAAYLNAARIVGVR